MKEVTAEKIYKEAKRTFTSLQQEEKTPFTSQTNFTSVRSQLEPQAGKKMPLIF